MSAVSLARCVGSAVFVLAVAATLPGCGGAGGRTAKVSGTVTFDGKPLEQGKITFRGTSKDAPPQSGDIKDGKFECSAGVGKPTVEIDAFKAIAAGEATGMGQKNYIPEKYNAKSELTAEVTDAGPNEFKFELRSK